MNNLFSYDSKPMQILMFLGDLIILNMLYLVCCLPIVTIGAAQAGLHTGIKVLLDPEDDTSPAAAFFRGLSAGFGKVTLAWGLMTLTLILVAIVGILAKAMGAPSWIIVISVVLVAIFHSLVPAFHARFDCKPLHLIRNCWFLLFAHPLRSILVTALIWIPMLLPIDMLLAIQKNDISLAESDLFTFMRLAPVWGTIYYSGAFCFIHTFLKKPFQVATDHFNKTHGITPEGEKKEEALEDITINPRTNEDPELPNHGYLITEDAPDEEKDPGENAAAPEEESVG